MKRMISIVLVFVFGVAAARVLRAGDESPPLEALHKAMREGEASATNKVDSVPEGLLRDALRAATAQFNTNPAPEEAAQATALPIEAALSNAVAANLNPNFAEATNVTPALSNPAPSTASASPITNPAHEGAAESGVLPLGVALSISNAVAGLSNGTPTFSQPGSAPSAGLPASDNQALPQHAAQATELVDDHRGLGPGDKVTYRVIEDQDEPRSLTVTDSGDVEVPYLGLVHAAGKTSLQLAKEIKGLLQQKLYYQATVVIAVELVNKTRVSGKVYVTGQVRNKGGYEIPAGENFTVGKAILSAGGFSDFSDKKHVRLIRKTPEGERTYIVNVLDVWDKSKLSEDLVVKPDDTVVVPARLINY